MIFRTTWGHASALFDTSRRLRVVDLILVLGVVGLIFGLVSLGREWTGHLRPAVHIDLDDPWALPLFTFYSLSRGLIAYAISLAFTLVYGYWAAKDRAAERVLIPLLDILQSIPVLSFLPGLVLALVAAFPTTNIGLELAAVLMIFTGQAWNMTFSFYHSLRSVPHDLREAANVYRLDWWQRLKWLELPYSAIGLVWNSMMSMAGGWFFLMVNEAFELGDKDFRLPGLGSYMKEAAAQGRVGAQCLAVVAMVAMIVGLDQLLWRPVVVWAQKFRMEEGGQRAEASSWFLDLLQHSGLLALFRGWVRRLKQAAEARNNPHRGPRSDVLAPHPRARWLSALGMLALLAGMGYGAWCLLELLRAVSGAEWRDTFVSAGWTFGRVMVSTALGTLWAVPAGLAIGLSPRLSRVLQPVVQVLASFPAPMLFPAVVAILAVGGVSLEWGSVLLMLLGTQWYILFNVVAGATAIPADLQEAARSYRLGRWRRVWALDLPAIFPYLVTGWVTAAGGAWNASIVSEYVTYRGDVLRATGLGARISDATYRADFPLLAAGTLVMCVVVVAFNRLVWRQCYRVAAERFTLNK
jgi:NitT/TauT family transport system permease protein